jgi:hypothetical protein
MPRFHTLTYKNSPGGIIIGNCNQIVEPWCSGSVVVAVPGYGYRFYRWNDGRKGKRRKDRYCTIQIDVSPQFRRLKNKP